MRAKTEMKIPNSVLHVFLFQNVQDPEKVEAEFNDLIARRMGKERKSSVYTRSKC